MSYDLVIQGRVLTGAGPKESFISIEDGIISKVSRSHPGHDVSVTKHTNGLILPGCIDSHVHFRDPGMTQKEDLTTGSLSAAFGGVTSFMDMPNTRPPTLDLKSFLEKAVIAKEMSYIDHGLFLGITPASDHISVLDRLKEFKSGPFPIGLKVFLGESTGSLVFRPIEGIAKVIEDAIRYHLPLSVHAEDGDLIAQGGMEGKRSHKGSLARHMLSRPADVELSAMNRVLNAAGPNSSAVHFLHISSKEGIERARDSGASVEVTPHHLLLDLKWCEANLELETLAKVNPPIRTTADRAALWDALTSGHVDVIGSDHAPHTLPEKEDGENIPSGMPGTETMFPLLAHEFMERRTDLRLLQKVLCEGPARRFGLEHKGCLLPGYDADLMVIDPKDVRKIRAEDLHSKCGWTAYEGFRAIFPTRVYSRGELLVEDGNICGHSGRSLDLRTRE
ncbi:MAG: dihydroorotase [Candidatus Thermoplasmatota archaeon]|jgi:dihydroorotase|nr:dihydroorotase [Candidatus Thermoplasmatota archaeon]